MTSTRRVSTKDKDKEDERKSDNKDICEKCKTRMWAKAQPDGRPAEHRWCPLFNAARFG